MQVQQECVTGAVQFVKLGLLTITQKSPWCQGEENVQKNHLQRQEISQRWTRGNPECRLKLNNICIYDDNNDYTENNTEEQLRKGGEMPVILAHKHRKAPPLPLAREHGTLNFLPYMGCVCSCAGWEALMGLVQLPGSLG